MLFCIQSGCCVSSPQKAAETEDQQTDSQVVANPEQYIKHPLQNRWE